VCGVLVVPAGDSDGDALNDGDEVNGYGTDPWNVDTDGDNVHDYTEIQLGTDPVDPIDTPALPISGPVPFATAIVLILIALLASRYTLRRSRA
jgi:hypothetical protein